MKRIMMFLLLLGSILEGSDCSNKSDDLKPTSSSEGGSSKPAAASQVGRPGRRFADIELGWGELAPPVWTCLLRDSSDDLEQAIKDDDFGRVKKLVDGGFVVTRSHLIYTEMRELYLKRQQGIICKTISPLLSSFVALNLGMNSAKKIECRQAGVYYYLFSNCSHELRAKQPGWIYHEKALARVKEMESHRGEEFSLSWFITQEELPGEV